MIAARAFAATADASSANKAINRPSTTEPMWPKDSHSGDGTQLTAWSFGENTRRRGLLGAFGPSTTAS